MNKISERESFAEEIKNFSESRMYYEKLADKYHIVKYVFIFIFIIFILLMCFFGYQNMSGDHFRYLIKKLDINPLSLDSKYDDISYATGTGVNFSLFKGDLAIAGEKKISLYNLAGDLLFREQIESGNANVVSSEKYMAVYISGSKNLALYNSFSCVAKTAFEDPIVCASLSDSGYIAVCLKNTSISTVYIYDRNFELIDSKSFGGAVIYDLDFCNKNNRIAITSLATNTGAYFTEVSVWDFQNDKIVLNEKIDNKKPIAASFFSDGRLCVAVNGALSFYQENGKSIESIIIDNEQQKMIFCDNQVIVLSNGLHISIYTSSGKERSAFSVSDKILSLKTDGEYLYILSDSAVSVYDEDGKQNISCPISAGVLDFFILEDQSLLLCYKSETKRITL